MEIIIKELFTFKEFEEISELQNKIWNLSDRDIISTITLKALTMKYPIMGLLLGAFHDNKMIGFVICIPTREPNTLYGLIMGVLPEFQNSEVGNKLGIKILEICLKQNVNKICWTFEPLDSILGHLYLNKWGAVAVRYEQNYYQLKNEFNNKLPLDRFIVDCNLQSSRVIERINKKIKTKPVKNVLNEHPVAGVDYFPNEKSVLVKIPSDFNKLKSVDIDKANKFRIITRTIFDEYINKRSYFIAELFSEEIEGERQNYYLMEKRSYL